MPFSVFVFLTGCPSFLRSHPPSGPSLLELSIFAGQTGREPGSSAKRGITLPSKACPPEDRPTGRVSQETHILEATTSSLSRRSGSGLFGDRLGLLVEATGSDRESKQTRRDAEVGNLLEPATANRRLRCIGPAQLPSSTNFAHLDHICAQKKGAQGLHRFAVEAPLCVDAGVLGAVC